MMNRKVRVFDNNLSSISTKHSNSTNHNNLTAPNLASLGLLLLLGFNSAQAEIAVIVNKDAAIDKVSITELSRLYLGKTNILTNGQKFEPIDQDEGNPVRDNFYQQVTNKSQLQVNAYWSRMIFTGKGRPPKIYNSDEEIIARIGNNNELVGYVDTESLNDMVKVIAKIPN